MPPMISMPRGMPKPMPIFVVAGRLEGAFVGSPVAGATATVLLEVLARVVVGSTVDGLDLVAVDDSSAVVVRMLMEGLEDKVVDVSDSVELSLLVSPEAASEELLEGPFTAPRASFGCCELLIQ